MPSTEANVFVSHAHNDSSLADAFSAAVATLFEGAVSVSYSTKRTEGGIPAGADWFRWIGEQVAQSEVSIILLTPQFVTSPAWMLWEAGAVYGAALNDTDRGYARVRPLLYRVTTDELPIPLKAANIQGTNGENADAMSMFFTELIRDIEQLDKTQAASAGRRLDTVVSTYLAQARSLLERPEPVASKLTTRDAETLKKLIELMVLAMQVFYPSLRMNCRYFHAGVREGRDELVRDEIVYFETLPMPEEFGLFRIDVQDGLDTLVICQAFAKRMPIYEVLASDLTDRYPPNVKDVISPAQGWVLACPVASDDDKPVGVLCFYGEKPPARNKDEVRRLRTIAMRLSQMVNRTLYGPGA